MPRDDAWTDEEITFLQHEYQRGAAWLSRVLAQRFGKIRSENAVRVKMFDLRLKRSANQAFQCPLCNFYRPLVALEPAKEHLMNLKVVADRVPHYITTRDDFGNESKKERGKDYVPRLTIQEALRDGLNEQQMLCLLRKIRLYGKQAEDYLVANHIPFTE